MLLVPVCKMPIANKDMKSVLVVVQKKLVMENMNVFHQAFLQTHMYAQWAHRDASQAGKIVWMVTTQEVANTRREPLQRHVYLTLPKFVI